MTTITIPKKEYQHITRRQILLEKELSFLKKVVFATEEDFIRGAMLRRWEQVSRSLDQGAGRSFASMKEMKQWLKKL